MKSLNPGIKHLLWVVLGLIVFISAPFHNALLKLLGLVTDHGVLPTAAALIYLGLVVLLCGKFLESARILFFWVILQRHTLASLPGTDVDSRLNAALIAFVRLRRLESEIPELHPQGVGKTVKPIPVIFRNGETGYYTPTALESTQDETLPNTGSSVSYATIRKAKERFIHAYRSYDRIINFSELDARFTSLD